MSTENKTTPVILQTPISIAIKIVKSHSEFPFQILLLLKEIIARHERIGSVNHTLVIYDNIFTTEIV